MSHSSSPLQPARRKPLPSSPKEPFRISYWSWEFASFLVSTLCIGAIVIILARFNQKPLPDLGFLTINGIIGTLAGIAKAALILPTTEAISQLKWLWFWNQTKPKPIVDFQIYDSASRGPWGSLCLLAQPRLMHYASLGAFITIIALAMEPSLQLIPSYTARLTPQLDQEATIPTSHYYSQVQHNMQAGDTTAPSGFQGAFYAGLYGSGSNQTIVPSCPTGNCTWPRYSSLAICR